MRYAICECPCGRPFIVDVNVMYASVIFFHRAYRILGMNEFAITNPEMTSSRLARQALVNLKYEVEIRRGNELPKECRFIWAELP